MLESITVSSIIPKDPAVLYQAWLSSKEHSAFTGSEAVIDPELNGLFSAWEGYISGKTIELDPPHKVVQLWRTTDFPEGSKDSVLTILFEKAKEGTKITLEHKEIPEGQGEEYEQGWMDFYFEPMLEYFK